MPGVHTALAKPELTPQYLGEALPFCPRPRAARFGAASGLEGHGRAQAAKRPSTTGRFATPPREQQQSDGHAEHWCGH